MSTFFERDTPSGSSGGGTIPGAIVRTGYIVHTLSAGQTDDFNHAGLSAVSVLLLRADAAGSSLSGIVAQALGTEFSIVNRSTTGGNLTLLNSNVGSSAANRFNFFDIGDYILPPGAAVTIWYNPNNPRWILI